jgi:hypothetical protein
MIELIQSIVEKHTKNKILAIIPYGSSVYCNKKPSDFDFVVVVDNSFVTQDIHNRTDIDVSIIDKKMFIEHITMNKVRALELLYTPFETKNLFITSEFKSDFDAYRKCIVNPQKIRENFSKTTSNSYVKAKKKLIIESDYDYISSLKSLWHSIRIASFGIQIVSNNSIDFKSCNEIYLEIQNSYQELNNNDKEKMWNDLHKKFKPIYNKLHSELKILCPKKNN